MNELVVTAFNPHNCKEALYYAPCRLYIVRAGRYASYPSPMIAKCIVCLASDTDLMDKRQWVTHFCISFVEATVHQARDVYANDCTKNSPLYLSRIC